MATDNKELLARVTQANQAQTGNVPEVAKKRVWTDLIESRTKDFEMKLSGSGMSVDRLKSILIKTIGSNRKLLEIVANNPASMLAACFEIAELGLDPSIQNEVFIVPYKDEAKAQVGYKGLMKLAVEAARGAGLPIVTLRADLIYANDKYERTYGDHPKVKHEPPPFGTPPGNLVGFVAVARDKAGKINFREMTVAEVKEHQQRFCRSMKNQNSPFYNGQNFESYGLKTVIRRLVQKDLPMSSKLSMAIETDDEIETEPGKIIEFPTPLPAMEEAPEEPSQEGSEAQ